MDGFGFVLGILNIQWTRHKVPSSAVPSPQVWLRLKSWVTEEIRSHCATAVCLCSSFISESACPKSPCQITLTITMLAGVKLYSGMHPFFKFKITVVYMLCIILILHFFFLLFYQAVVHHLKGLRKICESWDCNCWVCAFSHVQ